MRMILRSFVKYYKLGCLLHILVTLIIWLVVTLLCIL